MRSCEALSGSGSGTIGSGTGGRILTHTLETVVSAEPSYRPHASRFPRKFDELYGCPPRDLSRREADVIPPDRVSVVSAKRPTLRVRSVIMTAIGLRSAPASGRRRERAALGDQHE